MDRLDAIDDVDGCFRAERFTWWRLGGVCRGHDYSIVQQLVLSQAYLTRPLFILLETPRAIGKQSLVFVFASEAGIPRLQR